MQITESIAENIGRAWGAYLERDARPQSPHDVVYASAFRVCDRRMALDLTQPQSLPPWEPEQLARFRRGNDRERDLLSDLARVGRDADPSFTVIAQQEQFRLRDHRGRVAISGRVDARLDFGDGTRVPLEVKAWSPFLVDRIERFSDLFENPFTRSGAHQLLAYCYGAGVPVGLLLLDRSGLPKMLPVSLEENFDRVEEFLSKAERVLDYVARGELPPYLENDPDECRRCGFFGNVCNPPIDSGGVTKVLIDPALEAALERRAAIEKIGREYADLDDEIKKHLRGTTSAVIGKFSITGRWGKSSRLELPPALKTQYTKTDPRGRFTLEIVKF
jgi:hypothetical protein